MHSKYLHALGSSFAILFQMEHRGLAKDVASSLRPQNDSWEGAQASLLPGWPSGLLSPARLFIARGAPVVQRRFGDRYRQYNYLPDGFSS